MSAIETVGAEPLLKFAELLLKKGMLEEAECQLEEALRQDAGNARCHYLLAVVRMAVGNPAAALPAFRAAQGLSPDDVKILNDCGVALQQLGRPEEAAASYREALRLAPDYPDATVNLALLYKDQGRLVAAERVLREALPHQPDSLRVRYNLANFLHQQGRSVEAVQGYREVLRLAPEHLGALQNLLFALHYSPSFSDYQIYQEHLRASRNPALRGAPVPASPLRQRGGRIRLGYLSPDFRGHSVASFIEPVLAHHDRERFEIFCYANLGNPDESTGRIKGLAEHWRDLYQLSDEKAAALITQDRLDILVDLAGHTAGNRLPLFAGRLAPLQGTWLGYPDTTGMPAQDFRISDPLVDPPGQSDLLHSERLVRLPRCFCCYLPPACAPALAELPALRSGRVTFGSFNNLAKVTPEVIAVWGRILTALPAARLMLKCSPLADPEVCERLRAAFAELGIAPERLELRPGDPAPAQHLARYGEVDIALDTFPYNGTTTTCEALWMGVPVVTLAGTRHAARTGVTLLAGCGLEELIARTPEAYVELAYRLAGDLDRLQRLRKGLRARLAGSVLCDAAGVTREVEAAFEVELARQTGVPRSGTV
ncbi:hypothetical protein GMLC_20750 [Geomonas limicola]|uniref:protein O-GlcNAc transferase n=1 Tax=Geomonas limicola TaxID=2740186 RepID=A0A6V8N7E4_9BACT|nr:tetratricopeptide repeat protein [Geomonas limicola]GFO68496.1 hypothetical protein GMLC_20750 [Geomonas limicola]